MGEMVVCIWGRSETDMVVELMKSPAPLASNRLTFTPQLIARPNVIRARLIMTNLGYLTPHARLFCHPSLQVCVGDTWYAIVVMGTLCLRSSIYHFRCRSFFSWCSALAVRALRVMRWYILFYLACPHCLPAVALLNRTRLSITKLRSHTLANSVMHLRCNLFLGHGYCVSAHTEIFALSYHTEGVSSDKKPYE